jgi:hypothetical protein
MLADAVAIIGTMVCLLCFDLSLVLSVLLYRILCLGMILLLYLVCLVANTFVMLLSEVDR